MTSKIKDGVVTPAEASSQLAAEGLTIAARVLGKKAAAAPGESPIKSGSTPKLSTATESAVAAEIALFRKHDLVVTKPTIKSMMLAKIQGTAEEELFPDGMTNEWYYGFLDRHDMSGADTKPLESDRDLWLTSKV